MKKRVGIMMLAVVLFFAMAMTSVAAEKVFTLKYQQMRVAAEPGMQYYVEMLEKTLPALTNGRLKVKLFWSGDLVKSADAFDAVKSGVVDIIGMPSSYFKGIIPESSIEYGLPFGIRTAGEMFNFVHGKKLPKIFGGWRAIDLYRKIYDKHGVYYLTSGADCWPAALMFNSPINKLSDLKGKKVRASGLMITWVERLGGQGVYIPSEETYTALQTKTINGATWGGGMGMYTMKIHEVCKYYLLPSLQPVNHLTVLVNKKVWASLPKDLQEALELAFNMAGMEMTYHQNMTGEQWALNKMAKAGVTFNVLKGAELEKAYNVAYQIWDEEAKKSAEAAELVKMTKSYMKEMGYMK